MRAAFTPGPWSENPRDGIPAVGIDVGDGGPLLPIATVIQGRTKKEARANRRLIAAAPDLLAALQMLSEALPSDAYMRAEGKEPGPGLLMMRAAIAKATGGAA